MNVLVVAPHADDETIGAGGTIARHVDAGDHVTVAIMTGHGDEPHPLWPRSVWEQVRGEAREALAHLGVQQTLFEEIPAALVAEQERWRVNQIADRLVREVRPEILYVPFAFDLHSDHRGIFNAFSVAWRPVGEHGRGIREVLCYEVLSETHWNAPYIEAGFTPNVWVDITATVERKIRALECYRSQMGPPPAPRSVDAMRALSQWRGAQAGMHHAEAFVLIRKLG